jgi:hypothetical protein
VASLLNCPWGRSRIENEGLRFNGSSGETAMVLNLGEAEEMVWLIDAAQAILAGQNAGWREAKNGER